jgi:uncharacterized protein YbjT (DUF2867 family)
MVRIFLAGASGFIGKHLLHALEAAGHEVTCGVRGVASVGGVAAWEAVAIDYANDSKSDWKTRLAGIDIVINSVGMLNERGDATFDALHVSGPRALFEACIEAGVRKVIQVSALGADADAQSRYHTTKRAGDDLLTALPLVWVIVQPSLVYGEGGASARLFAMMAALPAIPLPGDGAQCVQPVHVNDLCELIVRLAETSDYDRRRVPAVGPHALTMRDMLAALRRGMGLTAPVFVRVPMFLMRAAAALGDRLPGLMLNRETLGMLTRGNVGSAELITRALKRPPRAVEAFIAPREARPVANEARLNWLLPLLRASIAAVWIVTGVLSLGIYPVSESYALLARTGLTGTVAAIALYGAALLDVAFGIAIYTMRRHRVWLWRAQMLLIAGYTLIITIHLPEFWLHPYGPVLKNLPLLAAILVLHEFEERPDRPSGA